MKFSKGIAGLLSLAVAFFASTALAQPSSVAFWYADEPPLPELSQFEWVVVEPGHVSASDLAYLKAQGRTVFAYLSVGEYHGDLTAAGLKDAASSIRNSAWNRSWILRHPPGATIFLVEPVL